MSNTTTLNATINIMTFMEGDGTFYSICPQFMYRNSGGFGDPKSSEEDVVRHLAVIALEKRNEQIIIANNNGHLFDMLSLPITVHLDVATKVFSETPNEVARKLELLELVNRSSSEEVAKTLTVPCEQKFVLSLSEFDILKMSVYLTSKLRMMMPLPEPQNEENG